MRIGIDARFYGPTGKGLGRYTQEIVDNVIRIAQEDCPCLNGIKGNGFIEENACEFVVFLSKDNFSDFICLNPCVRKVLLPIRWYSWQEQLLMPRIIKREKLDLIHYPHFNVPIMTPIKFVVTIHDLILTHFPTLRATTLSPLVYFFKNLAYRLVISRAIKKAHAVITVSNFTKRDLLNRFPINPEKIRVTYEGVVNFLANEQRKIANYDFSEDEFNKYKIFEHDFLLYVGSAYPHKNLNFLIKVFSRLRSECPGLRLALVGKIDYFYQQVRRYAQEIGLWSEDDVNSPIVFTGYVPDNQLAKLYQKARAYVFPSCYEGFGLPPLEAMANQCPVISSDKGSLPEVLGSAAIYFDPKNEQMALDKIKEVLNDNNLQADLRCRGLNQVARYSWDNCARETWEIYKQALNFLR